MSVYEATVDPSERNTSHTQILELVGQNKRVLDVGCASGYLAEALNKNGCVVSGIEFDATEAEKARPFLDKLVVADLNEVDLAEQFDADSYDVVVFGDVLEHLLHPDEVLSASLSLLRADGSVVISIPNVAHGSVRLALLQGRWNYTDTGLLDRTHIRFVTYESLLAMLERAGLVVTELRATVADPLGTEVDINQSDLPAEVVTWVRDRPHAQVYQFVLSAQRTAPGVQPAGSHVLPAVPLPEPRDMHWEADDLRRQVGELTGLIEQQREALAQEQEQIRSLGSTITVLRRQVLTGRDHAIGIEAQLGRQRAELARVSAERHAALADAHSAHVQLSQTIDHTRTRRAAFARWIAGPQMIRRLVRHAVGPRVYAMLTAPIRRVRGISGGPAR